MTDSYIGVPPQSGFISQEANQYFTGLTQNYIDLNQSISSLSSVIILVNGVVQENSTMSLTSSTRITLGDTLVSADKVTCIYVAKISSTQAPAIGTVTNDMLSGSIANSKLATDPLNASNLASGTVPTARLGSGTASSSTFLRGDSTFATAGGDNTPYFQASITSTQTLTNDVTTKINFDRADVDSASGYDTTNKRYTIPSGQGGYWHIGYHVDVFVGGDLIKSAIAYPYRNGSIYPNTNSRGQGAAYFRMDGNPMRHCMLEKSFIANYSASDYIELFVNLGHSNGSGNTGDGHEYYSIFWGYRLAQ